jgi:hypothetical protein
VLDSGAYTRLQAGSVPDPEPVPDLLLLEHGSLPIISRTGTQVTRLLVLPLEVFLALDAVGRPRYGVQSCSADFVAAGQALPKAAVSNATKG